MFTTNLLRQNEGEEPFNPKRYLDVAVTNIICSLLFGERYEYDDQDLIDSLLGLNQIFEEMETIGLLVSVRIYLTNFALKSPSLEDALANNGLGHKKVDG